MSKMFSVCVNILKNKADKDVEIGFYVLYKRAVGGLKRLCCTHKKWIKICEPSQEEIHSLNINLFKFDSDLKLKTMDVFLKIDGIIRCYSFTPENFANDDSKCNINIKIPKQLNKFRPTIIIERILENKKPHIDNAYRYVRYDSRNHCCLIPTKKQISVKGIHQRLYIEHEQDRERRIRNRNRPIVHNDGCAVM
jgi:hypothetical protein